MNLFEPRLEGLARRDIEQLQLERLQALVARLKRNVRHYRERLGDVRVPGLDEVGRLPLTAPEDLAAAFPFGMLALPLREVTRIHSAVGLDGAQLVVGCTRNDLATWGHLVARQYAAADITGHDVIQVAVEGGAVPGAHGYALGAEHIEASIVAEDPYCIEHQLALLQNYRATALVTSPTRAAALVELLVRQRLDPHGLSLQTVLLSRPVTEETRSALGQGLSAEIRCNFGIPEVMEPGLCVECAHRRLHLNEDHFLAEVVDGELVLSTLTREAMPLLRYRTRVGCSLSRERCDCGRTGAILTPGARLDARLLVNERWIHPSQISALLAATPVAAHPFRVTVTEQGVRIAVRLSAELFSDTVRTLESIQTRVQAEFQSRLGVVCELTFVEPRLWTRP